jgi:phosphate-selective porin OprO/OprP
MQLKILLARGLGLAALSLSALACSLAGTASAAADESSQFTFAGMLESNSPTLVQPITFADDEENEEAEAEEEAEQDADDEKEIDDRFKKLEEQLESFEKSLEEVAEKAGNKSIVVSGSSKSTMKVSGRIHADAWGFDDESPNIAVFDGGDDPENRIGFRRLRFGVAGAIKDNMLYKIEMEFAGGNRVEFRDAYLGWTDLPLLQTLLLGNQKRPYGLDHLNSSRYNVFLERPLVIEANNQDTRRLGLASYGFSDDLAWNWRYGVFNQENVQATGNYTADHLQLEIAGRLANTFWYDEVSGGRGYAHWAVSGTHADNTAGPDNAARWQTRPEARSVGRWLDTGTVPGADYFNLLGLEAVVNVGALQVVGEYQSVWQDRNGFADTRYDGGYVYASYFLTGEHMPWDRESGTLDRIVPFQNFWFVNRCDGCREAGWGAWQVALRYSIADYTDQDIFGGQGEAWTAGLNWYWNPNARMQLNYITGEIQDRTAALLDGRYNIWGARFMVDF